VHKLFRGVAVIPVLTIEREEDAVPLARALLGGGLPLLEVTLRTPAALTAIAAIVREVPQVVVGAGTVQRPADVVQACTAGARFLANRRHRRALRHQLPDVAQCADGRRVMDGAREAVAAGDWATVRRLFERAAAIGQQHAA
jgi:hypothetical protein